MGKGRPLAPFSDCILVILFVVMMTALTIASLFVAIAVVAFPVTTVTEAEHSAGDPQSGFRIAVGPPILGVSHRHPPDQGQGSK
jgi:hypothetical protein